MMTDKDNCYEYISGYIPMYKHVFVVVSYD